MLSPKDRTEDVGVHYLVIKPIVEPGIKSINTSVTVVSIAAQCKYWNETGSFWSEDGCRVGGKKSHPNWLRYYFLKMWSVRFDHLASCFVHRLVHSPHLWSLSVSVTTWLSLAAPSLSCLTWWMCHAPLNFSLHSQTTPWWCVLSEPFFVLIYWWWYGRAGKTCKIQSR